MHSVIWFSLKLYHVAAKETDTFSTTVSGQHLEVLLCAHVLECFAATSLAFFSVVSNCSVRAGGIGIADGHFTCWTFLSPLFSDYLGNPPDGIPPNLDHVLVNMEDDGRLIVLIYLTIISSQPF
jgi:hypothetical protein